MPLNTLIANNGTVAAGGVIFGDFRKPGFLPIIFAVDGVLVVDFNDIGVSAAQNPDGAVSLTFLGIGAGGAPVPVNAEFVRPIGYSVTVQNPGLRLHSVEQRFGPGTTVSGTDLALAGIYAAELVPNTYEALLRDSLGSGAGATVARNSIMPSADGSGTFTGSGGILLPGGNS